MDVQTHLPLSRSFQWRDPLYKDKNTDVEEYADYHDVDGFPTAFSITRVHNDEMVAAVVHRQGALQPGSAGGVLGYQRGGAEDQEVNNKARSR